MGFLVGWEVVGFIVGNMVGCEVVGFSVGWDEVGL